MLYPLRPTFEKTPGVVGEAGEALASPLHL